MKLFSHKSQVQQTRGGLWILIVAAVVLETTACIQYFYSRASIRHEAERRAEAELRRAELEIEKHTIEMETAAKMLAMLAERHIDKPDSIYAATRAIVATIENTSSVAVAFVPGYFSKQHRFFEACSSRISKDSIYTRQIGSVEHDYTQMEWFQNGLAIDSCWWCELYLDDSGSQTFVVSCSCPVHDKNGKVVAVVCVDLSLDYLKKISDYLQIYKGSYYSIRSSKGEDIVAHPDTIAGRKYAIFDEEIDTTGWHISIIIPEDVIYGELRKVGLVVSILMLLGLVLLIFIMYRAAKNLISVMSLSSQKERYQSELNIARSIQMAMLPTRFPPFPDYQNLNAYGEVIPAKQVGGDLFDFYIRDNKLLFCIGDVSGKGVPASLVMAVTRSLFRSFTSYIESPAQVMEQMNNVLSGEDNTENMFVTLFVGTLDLASGKLSYCNAGHDAPMIIDSQNAKVIGLPVMPNIPLGVLATFSYTEQTADLNVGDTIFLYTDGLTEAENNAKELFGEERMLQVLNKVSQKSNINSQDVITDMQAAVSMFVGSAQRSDDLTMFVIRFLAKSQRETDASELDSQKSKVESHHSLVMRNDIQQIPTLAEWLDTIGLPQAILMPMNLALEEAVSNVMLYAYPETNSGRVLVEAEKSAKQVVFTISDTGIPFDPTQKEDPDVSLSLEERTIGGLGIFLVRQIMDDIRYERKDNKNILTLTKKL